MIVVDERNDFNRQTRAYAEYRAFSTLVGRDEVVGDVKVTLTRGPADGTEFEGNVACTIAVEMAGDFVEVQAVARHAYAAIDRAVAVLRRTPPIGSDTHGHSRSTRADCESA
jgi:hypothetical protein